MYELLEIFLSVAYSIPMCLYNYVVMAWNKMEEILSENVNGK